jgi:hypothetical protein
MSSERPRRRIHAYRHAQWLDDPNGVGASIGSSQAGHTECTDAEQDRRRKALAGIGIMIPGVTVPPTVPSGSPFNAAEIAALDAMAAESIAPAAPSAWDRIIGDMSTRAPTEKQVRKPRVFVVKRGNDGSAAAEPAPGLERLRPTHRLGGERSSEGHYSPTDLGNCEPADERREKHLAELQSTLRRVRHR